MTPPKFVLVNDTFVPADRASLPVSDLAVQRGYGVFDFFRTVGGRALFLDEHLDRFYHSAARLRLAAKRREEFKPLLAELMDRNGMPDSGVRLTLTGGDSPDGYSVAAPNLVVTQRALAAPGGAGDAVLRLITHPHRRQFADVKTLDYVMAIWLLPLVKERGADDVLYHDGGVVSECPRSNFFVVTRDGRLATARADRVLAGVVRGHVLRIARGRFGTVEGDVTLDDLRTAREAFVTSTTKGVLPVVRVDGEPVGDGRPGEVTRWLAGEFGAVRAAAAAAAS